MVLKLEAKLTTGAIENSKDQKLFYIINMVVTATGTLDFNIVPKRKHSSRKNRQPTGTIKNNIVPKRILASIRQHCATGTIKNNIVPKHVESGVHIDVLLELSKIT